MKVLGTLGQLEQCLRADDLAGCRRLRRIIPESRVRYLRLSRISSVSVRMVSSITTFSLPQSATDAFAKMLLSICIILSTYLIV